MSSGTALAERINANLLLDIINDPAADWPKRDSKLIANVKALGSAFPDLLPRFQINTPLRIAHFIAQIAHESDGFKTFQEYASGTAYEGRADLGNLVSGDGPRFKGRGPIQITGRSNYRNFTNWMRGADLYCPDFEREPSLVATAQWAPWAAVWYWTVKRLNLIADRDDLIVITKIVNGGKNGLASRGAYLARAKTVIAKLDSDDGVLVRGDRGDQVEFMQRALSEAGFYHLAIDGAFGPATEQALILFQKSNGLNADGHYGPKTASALAPFQREA